MLATVCRLMVAVAGYLGSVPLMLLFTVLTSLGEGPWQGDMSAVIAQCSDLDNAVQPDSCINMMYFMYLWLPFIFDIIITVILSFLNVESANMKLKENMQNQ